MWREYSSGYMKNNRSSGISIIAAAFISALLLSLLCGVFYNLWKYEIERIQIEEGGWQSRIEGKFDEEDIKAIRNFPGIEDAAVKESESQNQDTVVDLYFKNIRDVLIDTPRIAKIVGISPEDITYHDELLAMYMIRDSKDTAPRLTLPFFILITVMASVSLILLIHNAFAVSMKGRIHQFGIFSSVGASPKQIKTCLIQEAAVLCAVPIIAGNLLGIVSCMGLLKMTNVLAEDISGRHEAVFGYHPFVFFITLFVTMFTIGVSVWLPARKLSRMTPLEAIKNSGELQLKKKKNSPILAKFFGIEGELAGNALKAQKKSIRMASLSLFLSFMAFTLMQCFFTLSGISTRETYFEKYQDAWDIMVTVKDTEVEAFSDTEEIQSIPGVRSAAVYQKAMAKRLVTEEEISEEMKENGGFSHALEDQVIQTEDGWFVNVPVVILDDASFLSYCEEIGIMPCLDGTVIWNQIRDVTNPDFRHPEYMPYVKGENPASVLRNFDNADMAAELTVLAYTDEVPVLREEYATLDYYELVHFVPVSLWKEIKDTIGKTEEDTYIRVLGRENVTLDELNTLQREIDGLLGGKYTIESENRIQEYETNDEQIQGMMAILSSFCILLAVIGVSNVFSNTLGFVRQRRREFARYMSVGMTPGEIRKMFCIEAFVIVGRPVLFTVLSAVILVWGMIRMSYLNIGVFLAEAPFLPISIFMIVVVGAVIFAYYLGWRNVRKINLSEALRDDTMI